MGRIYTVNFAGVAVTAQQDLFEITAPATGALVIHAIELSQSTEIGDAQEEGVSILFRRGTSATTSGSGGSTATPVPQHASQGASGFSAETNNTTRMSGGTITTLIASNWNIRQTPMQWLFTPELRPVVAPSARFTVELATTVADSVTMSGTMWVEEIA